MGYRTAVSCVIFICLVITVFGCKSKKETLREKLDSEYELATKELQNKSVTLQLRIKALVAEHQKLKKIHQESDVLLENIDLTPTELEVQKNHALQEAAQEKQLHKTQIMIDAFKKRHAEHEEMEENHDGATEAEILAEHEQFENDLKQYTLDFQKAENLLLITERQMQLIISENDAIITKYRKSKPKN